MSVKSCYTRVLIDRYDLSGDSNQIELTVDANAIEYNVFQNCATQSIAGEPTSKITHSGYYSSPDAGEIEQQMHLHLGDAGSLSLLGVILDTAAAVPVGYAMESVYADSLKIEAKAKSLITVQGSWSMLTGQLYRGYQLWAGTISATGAKTGVDFGSAGAAGGRAWMWFHSNVGTVVDGTIIVQSDDNASFTTPTTRGTFTFSTAGLHHLEIDLPTVERYLRISTSDLGGGTSFNVTVVAGVAGITM